MPVDSGDEGTTVAESAVQPCWRVHTKISIVGQCRVSALPIEKFPAYLTSRRPSPLARKQPRKRSDV